MALLLVGIVGSQSGRKFDLSTEITIGREAGNTIVLAGDSGVSRRHARIFWLQGLPMLEDMGSRNGTLLNGARLSQARPVSSGDEIRVGAEVFRVEAAMDQPSPGATPQARGPGQERSAGEGRGRHNRKTEQGSAERTLYKPTAGPSSNGCSMPDFDLSGCMRYLWILLLILIAAAILALIVFGIGALLSAAGGIGAAGGSTPAPTQPAPQDAPPPTGGGGGGAPPPQQQQQEQQQEGIVVVDVQVKFARRGGEQEIPVVLVKWANATKAPVKSITGTVRLFDSAGKQIAEIPRESIYAGPEIQPGETHEDRIEEDGISIRKKLNAIPATAKVTIEKVE